MSSVHCGAGWTAMSPPMQPLDYAHSSASVRFPGRCRDVYSKSLGLERGNTNVFPTKDPMTDNSETIRDLIKMLLAGVFVPNYSSSLIAFHAESPYAHP